MDSPPLIALNLSTGVGGSALTDEFNDDFELEDEDTLPVAGRATPSKSRSFKDNVHDYLEFDERICQIIDTPHFQRLRHVQQLGTSSYVWPAASHNRFAHCLGVAHLAQKLIKTLQFKQPELKITEEDVYCVTAAGLCHDLGHGPWSHVWDVMFIPKAMPGKNWKHEDASEMMFDALIKLDDVNVSEREAIIIKALIAGDPGRCSRMKPPVKRFLFEIVANKRNGLDVDKFDYIARDNRMIGQGENISLNKLLMSARVIDNEICYDIKDANSIYELCWARFSLHKRIYNHKTAKAIEHMLIDALLAAEPYMKIASQIEDPDRYLYLTDDIKTRIQMTSEPELAPARAILDRIDRRKLYKCVDYRVWQWQLRDLVRERITPESIVRAAKRYATENPYDKDVLGLDPKTVAALSAEHVIVDVAEMHCGMKEKNPLRFVRFYSKQHPNQATHAEASNISHIMPEVFAESLVRIYTRNRIFHGLIYKGYNVLIEALNEENVIDAINLDSPGLNPVTGPAKRAISRVTSLRLDNDGSTVEGFGSNVFTAVPANYKGEGRA